MCGIAGLTGRFSPGIAARMGLRIAARGPDSHDVFEDAESGIALAHRRLSIVDLSSAGHQPMTDASGRYVIAYNGEVYNYLALRDELTARGRTLRGHSDTEVILEHFAEHGPEILSRLNGIFALAIWDRQDRALWLARDGMGVKPLYVTRVAGGLAFASEMKALLEVPGLNREIDRVAVAAYLGYLYSPGERTMFEHVRKLEPGTWLRVDHVGAETTGRFHHLPDYQPVAMSANDVAKGTRAALATAVERQMIADVEVGAFLSGGLDSSAIVALAREHSAGRMQCFTIDYRSDGNDSDEMIADLPYARAAAQHLDVDLHEIAVDARIASEFESLVYTLDEPQADPAALNSLKIAALSRQHGIKVLLSGAGGDDVFTGYRRHQAAALDRYLDHIPGAARSAIAAIGARLPGNGNAPRRLRKLLAPMGKSADDRLMAHFEWQPIEAAAGLMATDRRDALAHAARAPMRDALQSCAATDPIERILRLDQRFFLTDHNLNYSDKTGMAMGVEIRVPFLDPDLMAFAASMPTEFKLRGRTTKWALREAMAADLPRDILYRPKTGFGVPLRAWMRRELQPMMNDVLSHKTISRRGLFDADAVEALRTATEGGTADGHYTLLGVMAIELWCRAFVDAPIRTA